MISIHILYTQIFSTLPLIKDGIIVKGTGFLTTNISGCDKYVHTHAETHTYTEVFCTWEVKNN